MGGVSTGSLLNQRVYSKNTTSTSSTKKGGGVQTNALIQTRVTLANRSGNGKRAGLYTSLSNRINGRKEVIYVGGQSCCGQAKMSTMDKIAAYMSLAQTGLQLAQGIAGLFDLKKSEATEGTTPRETFTPDTTPKVDNSLASTLNSFVDIDLNDVDYKDLGNDFISAMKNADNSAELYQSITNAKAYRGQIQNRINSMDLDSSKFNELKEKSSNAVSTAKEELSKANEEVGDAESAVKQEHRGLDGARDAYDSAKNALKIENEKYKDAENKVKENTTTYDTAETALATAKKGLSDAKGVVNRCEQELSTAKVNTENAAANLDALLAMEGTANDGVALQAQISTARTNLKTAQQAEQKAEKALHEANTKKAEAEAGVTKAQGNFAQAKTNLQTSRNTLLSIAKDLASKDKDSQQALENLENRTNNLEQVETRLETAQNNLAEKQDAQVSAQNNYDTLSDKHDELEMKINDYNEMVKADEKLNDAIAKYEKKLTEMETKEQSKRDKLETKRDKYDAISNDEDSSARQAARAEIREGRASEKMSEIDANRSGALKSRDAQIQAESRSRNEALGAKLEWQQEGRDKIADALESMTMQYIATPAADLLNGGPKPVTINGHSVELKDGKYFIDGSTMGVSKDVATWQLSVQKEFEMPKFDLNEELQKRNKSNFMNL